jgi:hypothetical protein
LLKKKFRSALFSCLFAERFVRSGSGERRCIYWDQHENSLIFAGNDYCAYRVDVCTESVQKVIKNVKLLFTVRTLIYITFIYILFQLTRLTWSPIPHWLSQHGVSLHVDTINVESQSLYWLRQQLGIFHQIFQWFFKPIASDDMSITLFRWSQCNARLQVHRQRWKIEILNIRAEQKIVIKKLIFLFYMGLIDISNLTESISYACVKEHQLS